jgi:hypothetical protein
MAEYSLKLTVKDTTIETTAGRLESVESLFKHAIVKRMEIQG